MNVARNPFDTPSFSNPWSLRVFGVTLAAAEAGLFTLQEFQAALIAQIGALEATGGCVDCEERYYSQWTEALTALLLDKQVLQGSAVATAEQAVRDALQALRHDHVHDHGHDHEHPHAVPLHIEPAR